MRDPQAEQEARRQASDMGYHIRALVADAGVGEQRDGGKHRREGALPGELAKIAAAPEEGAHHAQGGESGCGSADGHERRWPHEHVQGVAENAAGDDAQPSQAAAQIAPGEGPEQAAEHRVGDDVAQVGMQRQGRTQAPDFAGKNGIDVETPGAAPIPAERRRRLEGHDQPDDCEIGNHSPAAAVDSRRLWKRRRWHILALVGREFQVAGRHVVRGHGQMPCAPAIFDAAVDAAGGENQLNVRKSRRARPARMHSQTSSSVMAPMVA